MMIKTHIRETEHPMGYRVDTIHKTIKNIKKHVIHVGLSLMHRRSKHGMVFDNKIRSNDS